MENNLTTKTSLTSADKIYDQVAPLIREARQSVARSINTAMVTTYWLIGRYIVEEEQRNQSRAEYGTVLLRGLAERLNKEFGKGFSHSSLGDMRQFYLAYPGKNKIVQAVPGQVDEEIFHTVCGKSEYPTFYPNLSWSHYRLVMRITKPEARTFYEVEASKNNWSVRELERQIGTLLFDRLSKSKNKETIEELSKKGHIPLRPEDAFKEPVILDFLNIPEPYQLNETSLEQALIHKLQYFLLELGKGFAFVARQKRLTLDGKNYYTDLVFYHIILKCYVLIELKTSELNHHDLGQMQFYVNYFDKEITTETDNPTLGLILCTNKSDAMVQYTLGDKNEKIFAKKYQFHLPTIKELEAELKREIESLELS